MLLFTTANVLGQSITVTPFSLDNDLRVLQLEGKFSLDHSLALRPINFSSKFTVDSLHLHLTGNTTPKLKQFNKTFFNNWGKFSILPVTTVSKFTSRLPYGWSDGALIPAKGIQTMLSAGFYLDIGPLSIQLRPEFIYANNPLFEGTPEFGVTETERNYRRVLPGQSRVAINVGPFSLAISTENLWWGPGQFTSLLMSNNAAGFPHLSFNTRRPLKTAIGNFEWQIIVAQLQDEILQTDEVFNLRTYKNIFGIEPGTSLDWKYMNAAMLSYQPVFLKNLSVGIVRTFVTPNRNVSDSLLMRYGYRQSYLPIFDGLLKQKLVNEDNRDWNQLATFFVRYVLPKAKAEVYAEYGWNDHKYNVRDFAMSLSHSSAYIVGFKKVVQLNNGKKVDVNLELNQMEQPADNVVRGAGGWYVHFQDVRDANLSHRGQVLGSGIGYGSNVITLSASIRERLDSYGFIFERVQKNPIENNVRWKDMTLGFIGRKRLGQLLVNVRVSGILSKNYAWVQNKDRFNLMTMFGASYFF